MKNRHEFLSISMLLPLLLFFSPGVYTQLAKDPQRDLSVSFSSKHEGTDPGSVFGVVTNKSANAYPCVRIEFDLYMPLRPLGPKSHLGVIRVEVRNVHLRAVRDYQRGLPFLATIGLKSVSECPEQPTEELPDILSFTVTPPRIQAGQTATLQWRTANTDHVFIGERNPEWPRTSSAEPIRAPRGIAPSGSLQVSPSQTTTYTLGAAKWADSVFKSVTVEVTSAPAPAATCSITGRVSGRLRWDTKDDRGQPVSFILTHISMTTPGADQPVRARVRRRTYIFANVPAGQTYKIFPYSFGPFGGKFRSQPRERTVSCQPNTTHRGEDFEITGPPPIG